MKNIEAEFTYKQLKEMRDKPIKQLARKKVSGRMVNQIGYVVTIVIRRCTVLSRRISDPELVRCGDELKNVAAIEGQSR